MKSGKRIQGICWCQNIACKEFSKKKVQLAGSWVCPTCSDPGGSVTEAIVDENTHNGVYKTVKVEFNFDVLAQKYREIAVIDIPILRTGGVYTTCNPYCSTEKRALAIGTTLICSLNSGGGASSQLEQTVISFDNTREQFSKLLADLGKKLAERERRIFDAK